MDVVLASKEIDRLTAERDAAVAGEGALREAIKKMLAWVEVDLGEDCEHADECDCGMSEVRAALATPAPVALERLKADSGRARAVVEFSDEAQEVELWADTLDEDPAKQKVVRQFAVTLRNRADEIAKEGK